MAKTNSNVRMTGKDYRNEYKYLIGKQDSLKAKVSARLLELCKQYPDAIITTMGDTDIKAKSIIIQYINTIETVSQIMCIERIEKWLADQSPVKQGKLFN
jgi:hypothetical protein